ncbi:DEAD/DEAH box helicase [Luteococcus sp. H138]|uniref:DEAD/DEAH box helicase n=1 Tax=unclassified Luteococcus TaxID=2639923 RepID=UPI00313B0195
MPPAPPPSWLSLVTDDILRRAFDPNSFARGQDYARRGKVLRYEVVGTTAIVGKVSGSGHQSYTCRVHLNGIPKAQVADLQSVTAGHLETSCSCPVGWECKHAVALLIYLRDRVAREPRQSSWRQDLGRLVGVDDGPAEGSPLALEYTVTKDDIEFRPLKQGARGQWVKSDLRWDRLPYLRGFHPTHARVLRAISANADLVSRTRQLGYYYGSSRNAIGLRDVDHGIWALLAEAAEVGVELVPAKQSGKAEFVGASLDLEARVTARPDGLRLAFTVQRDEDEATPQFFVGDPAHGALFRRRDGVMEACGFRTPLTAQQAALIGMRPMHIPQAEVPDLAFTFLPRLREMVAVRVADDVELPTVGKPRVLVEVTASRPGPRQPAAARLEVGYRYGVAPGQVDVLPAKGRDLAIRDRAAEAALRPVVDELLPGGDVDAPGAPPTRLTLTGSSALRALAHLATLTGRDDVEIIHHGDMHALPELTDPDISVEVDDAAGRDWFDLSISMSVGDDQVPLPELLRALTAGQDHLVLESGWVSLDHPEILRLKELLDEAKLITDPIRGEVKVRLRPEHAGWFEELKALGVTSRESEAWTRASTRLLQAHGPQDVAPPATLAAELRPYQLSGLAWLDFLQDVGLGGILADDMGLGKTVQTLALLALLRERDELTGPALVVAPSSVVGGWVEQAERFVPGLRTVALTSTGRKRADSLAQTIDGADLVVTSYAVARLDVEEFERVGWQVVFLDEAQFVKNPTASTYQAMRRIPCKARFALSGTPLENNLMDLWALLSLTVPGLFPEPKEFKDGYAKPIEQRADDADVVLARLLRRIKPVMLRRTKESVAPELPPRQEQMVEVPLSPQHQRVYQRHLNHERRKVLGLVGDLQRNRVAILASLTRLRQLSLAAGLVDEASRDVTSAKIDALVEMLDDVVAGGHRALVFSSFTGFLGMVRDRLKREGIRTVYLDGRTRKRQERVDEFRSGTAPVFLISLKAGGFGLNLTEADYVFVLDPWWNPAAEAQAVDRAHRIGQTKTVMVYRLVSQDTIEAKVVELQQRKRELFSQVVDGGDAAVAGALSADDIRGLFD